MNASQTEPTSSVSPITPDAAADHHEPSGQEAARFALEFSDGNLTGLREYLARTRQARDWQDRILMLDIFDRDMFDKTGSSMSGRLTLG